MGYWGSPRGAVVCLYLHTMSRYRAYNRDVLYRRLVYLVEICHDHYHRRRRRGRRKIRYIARTISGCIYGPALLHTTRYYCYNVLKYYIILYDLYALR